MRTVVYLRRAAVAASIVWGSVAPAQAQFRPPADPATGETFHVEATFAYWNPQPELVVSSESLGIPGTDVDLVNDLGIEQKRQPEIRLVLRPARKHKFRFAYLPIKYEAEAVLQREFVFNGQRYRVGLPVITTADLTTYRFGYEYDFIARDRGYAGVLLDLKYTDVSIQLDSPIGAEFTNQVAPIPTIGFVGRGYVTTNIAIGGEVNFFKIPENLSDQYQGRYMDYDFYSVVNFTNNFGAQVGYRSIDVSYAVDLDSGNLKFKGWYYGGIVRF
ncbi:MAG: hypothetical protein AB7H88_20465 [Vicinamibacterales bacterium]